MKQYHFLQRIPENAVFWLLLFFLAAGSATSLYGKVTGRTETVDSGRVLSPVTVVSSGAARSYVSPLSHIETTRTCAALTFDLDGKIGSMDRILEILSASGTKATFFVSGQWIEQYPEKVKEISVQGHELGILAGTAVNYRNLSSSEIKKEIKALSASLKALTGKNPVYFRPPYEDPENPSAPAASKLGYTVVTYDCDSLDWKDYGAAAAAEQILSVCRPESGSILLFHGNGKYTADALEPVLSGLKESGLTAVPLSALFPDT